MFANCKIFNIQSKYLRLCTLSGFVENSLHRVYRGKLTTSCVPWKTYYIVCNVENLLNCVYCGQLTTSCLP